MSRQVTREEIDRVRRYVDIAFYLLVILAVAGFVIVEVTR